MQRGIALEAVSRIDVDLLVKEQVQDVNRDVFDRVMQSRVPDTVRVVDIVRHWWIRIHD